MRRFVLVLVVGSLLLGGAGGAVASGTAVSSSGASGSSADERISNVDAGKQMKASVRNFIAAYNRHDMDRTLAFFSNRAVVTGGGCLPRACRGKAQIRRWLADEFADNTRVTLSRLMVHGNMVDGWYKARSDGLREMGVTRIVGPFTVRFADTHIARLDIGIDEHDRQTAKFLAAAGGAA